MKRSLILAGAAAATLLAAPAAQAGGVSWSVGIHAPPVATYIAGGPGEHRHHRHYHRHPRQHWHGGHRAYDRPAPIYVPAPVHYDVPAPVWYGPAPVALPPPRIWHPPLPRPPWAGHHHWQHRHGHPGHGHRGYHDKRRH